MSLYINLLNDDEILNSYNFARSADIVFSEIVTKDQYEILKSSNTVIIEETDNSVFYALKQLEIKENDIIFTNTYFIELLFSKIKNLKFKNLRIISSQTDHTINKKLFKKKPSSVSNWYSTNVGFKHKSLHPIPLGLANRYANKNLHKKDYLLLDQNKNKINKLFVNFEVNTNYFHRNKIKKSILKHNSNVTYKEKISKEEYLLNLNDHKYVLCPWGNGLDSHRIWEALYTESIPLIPFHFSFNSIFQSSNFLFEDIKKLNLKKLQEDLKSINLNNDLLNINYWIEPIKFNKIENENKNNVVIEISVEKLNYNYFLKKSREYKFKKLKTLMRKIHNKVFN